MKVNPLPVEFTHMSGLADYKTIPPNDFSFDQSLNKLIEEEPIDFLDPETRGLIASIGIVKGQAFQPDGGCAGFLPRRSLSATPMRAPTPCSRAIPDIACTRTPAASG